jgi:tRNA-splicing ligase RtcB (3'-phosphate/5'-hydroxy nucleic acid ligase)
VTTINADLLISLGYKPSRELGTALKSAILLQEQGVSEEKIRKHLIECLPKEVEKINLRQQKIPLREAITPETDEEIENIELVRSTIEHLQFNPIVEGISIMPDACPAGDVAVGCGVVTNNQIIPSLTSSDLFCSMSTTFFQSKEGTPELIKKLSGCSTFGPFPAPPEKEIDHPVLHEEVWNNPFLKGLDDIAKKFLGTQGDGNHFAYIGEMKISHELIQSLEKGGHYTLAKDLYPHQGDILKTLVTHHGSRNLGAKVYKRGMEAAIKATESIATGIPKGGSWLDLGTEEGKNYWDALEYVRRWTKANHAVIHNAFIKSTEAKAISNLGNEHNAAWKHNGKVYHGKGATPAWKKDGTPQLGIIPLNMGREILIVSGADNTEFLSFAPHGAGRNRSRTATMKPFLDPKTGKVDKEKVKEAIEKETKGLHISWASGKADISESPLGYKDASKVKRELQEYRLAHLVAEIQPKGCIMAGEIETPWKEKRKKTLSIDEIST